MAVFWVVAPCSLALMMEAANTSETSVNFYQTTRRNNPEYIHLHIRRRENLKSQLLEWTSHKQSSIPFAPGLCTTAGIKCLINGRHYLFFGQIFKLLITDLFHGHHHVRLFTVMRLSHFISLPPTHGYAI
jgi:hypothetical protein